MKKTIIAGIAFIWLGLLCTQAEPVEKPWNFVFILLDDAGWCDLGFTGNDFVETPNMDRLAGQGMRFSTAYSSHPFCAPSRESMMTGQWPARTAWTKRSEVKNPDAPKPAAPYARYGAYAWTKQAPQVISLAEALKTKGYTTGHIGKWHFATAAENVTPESEGFDVNFGGGQHVGMVKNFFSPYQGLPGNVKSKPGEYLTDRLTDETITFIEKNKDRPFYVQLWHYAPHAPLMAPEEVVEKYRRKMKKMDGDSLNPTYAAMIDVVDQGIGRIFQTLENLDLAERTVVILTSDNGAEITLGSVPVTSVLPLRGRKEYLYEGGIREPMAIYWPGHTCKGSVSDLPVNVVDLYPTILDIANVPLPTGQPVDGVSLVPLLKTGEQPELNERPMFWYELKGTAEADGSLVRAGIVVRIGSWKLLKFFGYPLELYNLETDPSESDNLAAENPERAKALEKLADDWLVDTGIAPPRPNPNYNPDFIIPRQVSNDLIPKNAPVVREWDVDDFSKVWKISRMIRTSEKHGALQMKAQGVYPEIGTDDVKGLPSGRYAIQFELCVETGGRLRVGWSGKGKDNGVIELYPQRDGEWHMLTGVFETKAPLESIRFAAPTHLVETGLYDPAQDPDYIEVRCARLLRLEKDPGK